MADVVAPPLDASVQAVTIVRWLVDVGDDVAAEDPVCEVSLPGDGSAVRLRAPAAGAVLSRLAEPGAVVEVGAILAEVGEPPPPPDRAKYSPLARRLADDHDIDLTTLTGTGPGGRITREDVLQAAADGDAAPAVEPESEPETPPEPPRSRAPAAPVTVTRSFDPARLAEARAGMRTPTGRVIPGDVLLAKLVAEVRADGQPVNVLRLVEGRAVVVVAERAGSRSLTELALGLDDQLRSGVGHALGPVTVFDAGALGLDQVAMTPEPPVVAIVAVGAAITVTAADLALGIVLADGLAARLARP